MRVLKAPQKHFPLRGGVGVKLRSSQQQRQARHMDTGTHGQRDRQADRLPDEKAAGKTR